MKGKPWEYSDLLSREEDKTMSIEERIINIEKNQLKMAELIERQADTLKRTLEVIDTLVTKLTGTKNAP
jgi:hypothetical protein